MRDPAVQHDLVALWGLAYTEGLAVAPVPPGWLVRLNDMTGQTIPGDTTGQTKFNLRYGGKSHAIVIPVAEPMVSDIAALLAQVRTQLTT
ncbi:hypothetical protein [Noviherbaspirillum malthae]|uniref:hypothetical protein n=1 Tax=Noviherbaspirillum malthae TaxID=1260987 RepID=UPI00188E88CB|nr:hypothetical protein [Noviherbaspirillum malthae]